VDPIVARNGAAYRAVHGRYTLSVITVMEVLRGLHKKGAVARVQTYLGQVTTQEVLRFDQDAAELAGRIQGELERSGRPIGRADPMIAAIALRHGLELVTGNTAHYQYIRELGSALTLVNWRA
jgi:predicted nucleic acid-binding protein